MKKAVEEINLIEVGKKLQTKTKNEKNCNRTNPNIMIKIVTSCLFVCLWVFNYTQNSLNMTLLDTWNDPNLVPTTAHNNTYNDIWGYVQNSKEYALIGSTAGVHVIDVSNPADINEVVFIEGTQPSTQYTQMVHRDFKNYQNFLYMVSDEGSAALQIVDLSGLPTSVNVVYNSTALFTRAHNVFVDTTKAKLYVCGASNNFSVYDISNPINPVYMWDQVSSTAQWAIDMDYVHDCFVRNDTAYMNAGTNGLFVADFSTNPPTFLGNITTYPEQGYNHSGWLHPTKPIYVQGDETHGRDLKAFDVSDLTDIKVHSTFGSGVDDAKSIPHNQLIRDDIAFSSYYFDGVYAFNISNPASPTIRGYFDTSTIPHAYNYRGCWGVYPFLPSKTILASDMQNGLFVIDGNQVLSANDNELAQNKILVSPTIVEDIVTVKNLSNDNVESILIYDVSGKEVERIFDIHQKTTTISFEKYSKGFYFLKITTEKNQHLNYKLIKN